MKKFFSFFLILFSLTLLIFADDFTVPRWALNYMEYFINRNFIKIPGDYGIKNLNSRVLFAQKLNELLNKFADNPKSFSTTELGKLSKLCVEFSEELKFINSYDLSSLNAKLSILKNKLVSAKTFIETENFHVITQKGIMKNKDLILRKDTIGAQLHTDRAIKYFYMKRYNKALLELKQAISKFPNYLTAYFWLGRVYVKKGEYSKAIDMWQKVVNSLGNRIYISDFVSKQSDYNEVFMEILEVLSVYPDDITANKLLKTMQANLRSTKN